MNMQRENNHWLSMVTLRLQEVAIGKIRELSREIARSWLGFGSSKIFSFSLLAAIYNNMSARHSKI